ncbi:MAG TPA: hypothetical protein VI122_16010 [Thermoleophilaceae bacterium]
MQRGSVIVVRYALPAVIALTGLVLTIVGGSDTVVAAGVALIGVGMLVALLNLLMRLGIASSRDREREENARRYYDRHGRWPSG